MKKLLLLFTLLLTLGATSAWADTWTLTPTKTDLAALGANSKNHDACTDVKTTLNNADWYWSVAGSGGTQWNKGFNGGYTFGSTNNPISSLLAYTDYFSGKKVTEIAIKIKGTNKNADFTLTTSFGSFSKDEAISGSDEGTYTYQPNVTGTRLSFSVACTAGGCNISSISVTYEDAGSETPVDPVPVVLGDIVVTYNGVAVDEEVEVEKGESLNISAENAESISIYDVEDTLIKTINGSEIVWTPEADDIVTIEATLDGVAPKTRVISVTVKESETPVDPTPEVPADAIDVITVSSLGLDTNSGQTYKEYTKTIGNSEYKAYANIANQSDNKVFGIRPTTTNSKGKTSQGGGIVVTKSSGFVSRVVATQWSGQTTERTITVYGQHTPYTTPQATSDSDWGTELGIITLSKGEAVALSIKEKYEYIAIMPVGGACMFSEIKIEWVKDEETPELPEGAFDYTVDGIGEDGGVALVDGKAEITFSGVHKEVKIYFKHEAAAAAEPVVRKALDHSGFETAAYDEATDTHKITLTQPGTLTYYAAHDASGNAEDPKTITVKAAEPTTGIDSIAAEEAEGEVEYFNLQGVKVNIENAAPGLYIRRQGNAVSKVIL